MNSSDREELSGKDREIVSGVRELYAPPPRTAAQRAEFERRLMARTQRRSPMRWGPAVAAACAAAAVVWFLYPGTERRSHRAVPVAGAGGQALLDLALAHPAVLRGDTEVLPADLVTLSDVFEL